MILPHLFALKDVHRTDRSPQYTLSDETAIYSSSTTPHVPDHMEPLDHLPRTRRLVTGHDPEGKAIFEFDELLTPVNPTPKGASKPGASDLPTGVTLIHRTRNYPAKIQGGKEELTVDNVR